MPDPKQGDDEDQPGDPNARWGAEAAGVEPIGAVAEIEDRTTPEQKKRNEEAARLKDEALDRARQAVADSGGEDDDDPSDEMR